MIELIKPYPGESEESFTKRKAYYIREVAPRINYDLSEQDKRIVNAVPLSVSEKEEITTFWTRFLPRELYEAFKIAEGCCFYKSVLRENTSLTRYMPDLFYQSFIDEYFSNPQHSRPFDDKCLYDVYFHDINRPRTLFRKVRNQFMDALYQPISKEKAIDIAQNQGEVILKIGKFSEGGRGVMFWNANEDLKESLLDFLNNSTNVVCQTVIRQHAELSRLNSTSVNTIRIMTLLFDSQVHVLSSVVRMGINGARVDNASSGGIVCGIKSNGQLKDIAFETSGKKYLVHPQGTVFNSVTVPNFSQCVGLAKSLANRFSTISRLISWDFAIDEAGIPSLIEFNLSWGQLDFHQLCNGPIFGDMTEDVLKDVFANSYTLKSIIKSFKN